MIGKKSVWKFLLIIFISGMVGGIGAVVIQLGQKPLSDAYHTVVEFLMLHMAAVMGLTFFVMFGVSLLLFFFAKRRFRRQKGDRVAIEERVDPLLDWSIVCNANTMIVLITLYGLFLQQGVLKTSTNTQTGLVLGILIGGVAASILLEIVLIRFIQKIHPGKKGDPLSLKFQEQWLESCDELERRITYIAAYKTMMSLKLFLMVILLVLLLLSIQFPLGLAPFLVVGAVFLYFSIATIFYTHKLNKSGNVE